MDHRFELFHGEIGGNPAPRGYTVLIGSHDRIDAKQIHAAQQEGNHGGLELRAARQTDRRDRGAVFHLRQDAGEHNPADRIDTAGPAFRLKRPFRSLVQLFAGNDCLRAKILEVARRFRPAGYARDLIAAICQNRRRHRTHAACGAGHQNFAPVRRQPVIFQRQYSEHRREAGRTHGHGLFRRQAIGKRYQPVGLDPRFLSVAAPPDFAHAPARKHNLVARLVA